MNSFRVRCSALWFLCASSASAQTMPYYPVPVGRGAPKPAVQRPYIRIDTEAYQAAMRALAAHEMFLSDALPDLSMRAPKFRTHIGMAAAHSYSFISSLNNRIVCSEDHFDARRIDRFVTAAEAWNLSAIDLASLAHGQSRLSSCLTFRQPVTPNSLKS